MTITQLTTIVDNLRSPQRLLPALLFTLLLHFEASAQIAESAIHGKWVYGSVRYIDEVEPISPGSLRIAVGPNGLYHFLPNHRFQSCTHTCVNGTWEFEKKTNKVILFTDAGQTLWLSLTRADADTLTFVNSRKVAIHTLIKVADAPAFKDSVPSTKPLKPHKFKAWRLEGRWDLKNISEEKNVPADFRPATRIFKGWIYIFSKDGKVKSAHYETMDGTWQLERDGYSLVMTYAAGGECWYIVSLSETEMVLKKPGLPNLYTFKAEEKEVKKKKRDKKTYVEAVEELK